MDRTPESRLCRRLTTPAVGRPAGVESAIRSRLSPGSRAVLRCHDLREQTQGAYPQRMFQRPPWTVPHATVGRARALEARFQRRIRRSQRGLRGVVEARPRVAGSAVTGRPSCRKRRSLRLTA
nr:hypothetical protein E-122 - Halobacterium salinarum insertion sequence ISH50 [Halobacterium salinarum]CAB37935.1 hypothetical protein [Halobacterium salinarum]